jgi:K(+)-stimulated pyrophosphate-energized sodium pump
MASASSDIIISTILSFDTFGPIMDNAAGIVVMSENEVPKNLIENLDRLDALGNTIKAVTKGFALVCGGLSSIVLFLSFLTSTNSLAYEFPTLISADQLYNIFMSIHIFNPLIIGGIFIGMVLPFLYSSQLIRAVEIGARGLVQEVRRQYNEIPGLREGKVKPDYDKCIIISTKTALKNMIKPVLIVIVTTLLVGILFGPFVVAGFLLGNLIGCLILGFFLSIGGATFDNAKKGIESGLYGGKGSFAHKNAIIGDTIGDPMKDTAGPSMIILIKTINTISLTFLPVFMVTGFLWMILPI